MRVMAVLKRLLVGEWGVSGGDGGSVKVRAGSYRKGGGAASSLLDCGSGMVLWFWMGLVVDGDDMRFSSCIESKDQRVCFTIIRGELTDSLEKQGSSRRE